MKVLVWQDHGEVKLLKGSLSKIKEKVIAQLTWGYSEQDIREVEQAKTEYDFERAVKFVTIDDEQFEVFEFVNITEV